MAAWGKCFDPNGARHGIPTSLGVCVPCAYPDQEHEGK